MEFDWDPASSLGPEKIRYAAYTIVTAFWIPLIMPVRLGSNLDSIWSIRPGKVSQCRNRLASEFV
jgi:hypothetical protein